jgi:CHASE2 domain-containing sensor protein
MGILAKRKFNLRTLLLAGTTTLLLLIQVAGLLPGVTTPVERVEALGRDVLIRLRGVQPPSGEIVIVAIDDFSFDWTGYQWPWPRTYLAEIIDQINTGGAQVVGVDIQLFEPDSDPAGDTALAAALERAPAAASVLLVDKRTDQQFQLENLLQPLSPYQAALDGVGVSLPGRPGWRGCVRLQPRRGRHRAQHSGL